MSCDLLPLASCAQYHTLHPGGNHFRTGAGKFVLRATLAVLCFCCDKICCKDCLKYKWVASGFPRRAVLKRLALFLLLRWCFQEAFYLKPLMNPDLVCVGGWPHRVKSLLSSLLASPTSLPQLIVERLYRDSDESSGGGTTQHCCAHTLGPVMHRPHMRPSSRTRGDPSARRPRLTHITYGVKSCSLTCFASASV